MARYQRAVFIAETLVPLAPQKKIAVALIREKLQAKTPCRT